MNVEKLYTHYSLWVLKQIEAQTILYALCFDNMSPMCYLSSLNYCTLIKRYLQRSSFSPKCFIRYISRAIELKFQITDQSLSCLLLHSYLKHTSGLTLLPTTLSILRITDWFPWEPIMSYCSLIHIVEACISAINGTEIVGIILLECSKAFDLACHGIWFPKLHLFVLYDSTSQWLSSYLVNRVQLTYITGVLLSHVQVVSGVLQGCVLGAVFIIMFVNDLPDVVSKTTGNYSLMTLYCVCM